MKSNERMFAISHAISQCIFIGQELPRGRGNRLNRLGISVALEAVDELHEVGAYRIAHAKDYDDVLCQHVEKYGVGLCCEYE